MTLLRFAFFYALVLFSAQVAQAEEAPLVWEFRVGDQHHYRLTQDMDMEMSLSSDSQSGDPRKVETRVQQTIDMTWTVEQVDDGGGAEIVQSVDRLQMNMQAPGQRELHYDTASDKSPSGFAAMLVPLFKALTTEPISMSISSRGEIDIVEIPEPLEKALQAIPGAAMMSEIFSEEGFQSMIGHNSLVLPRSADLKPGYEWTRRAEMKNAQLGTITTKTSYRYLGSREVEEKHFEAFGINMTIDFGKPPSGVALDVLSHESDGEILFSREEGRLVSSKMHQEFELKFSSGDEVTTQKMVQKTSFEQIENLTE